MQSRIAHHETGATFAMALEIEVGLGVLAAAGLASGAAAYAARWPASQIFGRTLIAPRRPNEIALTFDDGPNPRWTPALLDTLAQHEVRATFFLIGQYAAQQPELVRRIHAAGHSIGNHTWTHPDLAITGKSQTREELTRTNGELERILGAPVTFFRPPFGSRRPATLRIARELELTPVMWNAMAPDWRATHPEQVAPQLAASIEEHTKQGWATTIVLHDGSHRTLECDRAASLTAAGLLAERFRGSHRFVTVDTW